MKEHIVQQGECLSQIIRQYGFSDLEYVWKNNPALNKIRHDWNVLYPGDVVKIPERRKKKLPAATGKKNTFQLKPIERRLQLIVQGKNWQVLANAPFTLEIDGKIVRKKTRPDGSINEPIPFQANEAILRVQCEGNELRWKLDIGYLNPVNDVPDEGVSGIQQRLRNLGLFTDPISGVFCETTRRSLKDFQRIFGLSVTGTQDTATIAKLRQSRRRALKPEASNR